MTITTPTPTPAVSAPNPSGRFAAIDFETADDGRDSACALGVVVVDGMTIVQEEHFFIRPPRREFLYTYIHGIQWKHVADKPRFGEIWPSVQALLDGVDFIAAHNASFDRSVLYHCCYFAGYERPAFQFQCTVKLARKAWGLSSAALPEVCQSLSIPLTDHHRADADARACAEIMIAARRQGLPLNYYLGKYTGALPV